MGFLSRLLSGSGSAGESETLTPAVVGQHLANMTSAPGLPDLLDMLVEGLEGVQRADAFFAVSVLELFSWIQVSQSDLLNLDRPSEQEIYDSFASFLVVKYLQDFAGSGHPDQLVQLLTGEARGLINVWNENQESEPGPQWYVAKEVWFMLQRDRSRPDPARIMALAEMLSTSRESQSRFMRDIEPYLTNSEDAT